jgi:hypothetical protein
LAAAASTTEESTEKLDRGIDGCVNDLAPINSFLHDRRANYDYFANTAQRVIDQDEMHRIVSC